MLIWFVPPVTFDVVSRKTGGQFEAVMASLTFRQVMGQTPLFFLVAVLLLTEMGPRVLNVLRHFCF